MKLSEIQKGFLDKVCHGRSNWFLNSEGEIDVIRYVNIDCNGILKMLGYKSLEDFGIQFGKVRGDFFIENNDLTSLNGIPRKFDYDYSNDVDCQTLGCGVYIGGNNLTEYFKNIKDDDFPFWLDLDWVGVIKEYPFLINKLSSLITSGDLNDDLKFYIKLYPQTKLYLE